VDGITEWKVCWLIFNSPMQCTDYLFFLQSLCSFSSVSVEAMSPFGDAKGFSAGYQVSSFEMDPFTFTEFNAFLQSHQRACLCCFGRWQRRCLSPSTRSVHVFAWLSATSSCFALKSQSSFSRFLISFIFLVVFIY
jgi:hypothetical protein